MLSIEERIVSLGLNNSNFEKHAAESLKTLEKLDTSLKTTGTQSGLENMESMLEKISGRFSTMGIVGDQVIRNITNQVMGLVGQMGNLVKSMSVDQITAGWSKYGDKTSAVQTIMAATAKDWADTGAQMEYVNGQLEKLNWFTDETSYSFLDMVNNIGKFTSNGIGLEESVTAMEGISTWAAISGANVQEAGRAMYNLSQAMAVGSVKLMDWKSIENANMATREFKDTALETAVAMGTLTKNADGTYRTLKNHDFTAEQFNTYLSDEWFSADVLMSVLNQYGSFTDKLNEATEATGTTASEFLEAMDTYKEGGEVASELIPWIQELSKDEYELGLRSFKAAQEAKTFKDAIDATKDAVSTGWMKTFELIFGNYQEAKKLWTDFANVLYDIFAEPGNKRNEFLEQAFGTQSNGAVKSFMSQVTAAGQTVDSFTDAMIKAGEAKGVDAKKLIDDYGGLEWALRAGAISGDLFKDTLNELAANGELTSEQVAVLNGMLENSDQLLTDIFNDISKTSGRELFGEGLMNILENISNILGTIGDAYDRVFGTAKERGEGLYGWIERFHDLTERMMLSEDALQGLENAFAGLFTFLQKVGNAAAPVLRFMWSILKFLGSLGSGLLEHLGTVDELGNKFSFLDWLADKLDTATTKVENFVKGLLGLDEGANAFEVLSSAIGKAAEWIGGGLEKIRTAFRETFGGDNMLGPNLIKTVGAGLMAFFGGKGILGLFKKKEGFLDSIKGSFTDALENISGILENVGNAFQGFANKMNGSAIKEVGIGVALVAASLVALSLINSDKLGQALLVITGGLGELILTLGLLDKLKIKGKAAKNLLLVAGAILLFSVAMIAVAGALVVLSLAVKIMSSMEPEKMWQGVLGLVAVLAAVSAALFILGKFASGPKMLAAGVAMIAFAAAMLIMVAAVAAFAFIPKEKLIQGMLGIAAALIIMIAAVAVLGEVSLKAVAGAAAMLILAGAMVVVALAIALLGMMPADKVVQGIGSMAIVLILMVGALALLSMVGPMALVASAALLVLSVALVLAAGALVIMALALNMIAPVKDDIIPIAGGLAVLGAALLALGIGGLVAGLGIVGAAALLVFGIALNTLVGIDIAEIAGGLALLGAALIPLGIGGVVLGLGAVGLVAGAPGLIALGYALPRLAVGLHALDDINWSTIGKAFLILTESIAGLLVLQFATLADGSVQLANLGDALIPLGAGLHALDDVSWETIGKAFVALAEGLAALIVLDFTGFGGGPAALKELGEGLPYLASGIQAFSEVGFWDLAKMFGAVATGIGKLMVIDTSDAANLITIGDGLAVIATSIAQIPENAEDILINLKTGITNNKGKPAEAMTEVADSMISALQTRQTDFLTEGQEISNAVADGISGNDAGPSNAVTAIVNSMQSVLTGSQGNWRTHGWNIAVGIANGINSGAYLSVNAITSLTNAIQNRLRSEMDINSPSRVMEKLGGYIDEGLAQGIQNGSTDIENGMITAISPAIAILSALQNGDYDIVPTIRPVMDLSDISDMRTDVNDIYMDAAIRNLGRMGDFNVDGASINYGLQNREVVSQIAALSEKLDSLGDAITNMQVVLDSGELIGATSQQMDNQLGLMAMRKGRGN